MSDVRIVKYIGAGPGPVITGNLSMEYDFSLAGGTCEMLPQDAAKLTSRCRASFRDITETTVLSGVTPAGVVSLEELKVRSIRRGAVINQQQAADKKAAAQAKIEEAQKALEEAEEAHKEATGILEKADELLTKVSEPETPVGSKAADTKAADTKAADTKAADTKAAGTKAADTKATK